MRLKISEIPEDGLDTEFTLKLKEVEGDARARLTINLAGPDLYITGQVEAGMELNCGRCLKEYRGSFSIPVEITCLGEVSGEEDEEHEEGFNCDEIKDGVLDLDSIVDEQVTLNAPMRPLCSDGCKGLCSTCGADLNEGDCGCDNSKVDPRMKVLEKLLNKGEKNNG